MNNSQIQFAADSITHSFYANGDNLLRYLGGDWSGQPLDHFNLSKQLGNAEKAIESFDYSLSAAIEDIREQGATPTEVNALALGLFNALRIRINAALGHAEANAGL